MRPSFKALSALTAALAAPVTAGDPVQIDLPVRARLDVTSYRSVAVAPFLTVQNEDSARLPALERELQRYLLRVVARSSRLRVERLELHYPAGDLDALAADDVFWRAVGERAGTDLILAGAVDFDFHDRSGYVTREFVSDYDGRTYSAQVLVEETGVELDLLIWVLDARSGQLLLADNLKEFRAFEGESVDPITGLTSNLAHLEARVRGLFAQRTVSAERLLQ